MSSYRGGDRGAFRGRGRGRGRGGFQKASDDQPRVNSQVQIFVENLPKDVQVPELCQFFSSVGDIKIDRQTHQPRVWLYKDKKTGEPTGECTITYQSSESHRLALQSFDGQTFRQGFQLRVTPSIVKAHMANPHPDGSQGQVRDRGRGRGQGQRGRPYGSRGFQRNSGRGDRRQDTRYRPY